MSALRNDVTLSSPTRTPSRTRTFKSNVLPDKAIAALQKTAALCAERGLRSDEAPDALLALVWARVGELKIAAEKHNPDYDFKAVLTQAYIMDDLRRAEIAFKEEERRQTERERIAKQEDLNRMSDEERAQDQLKATIQEAVERGKREEQLRRERDEAATTQRARDRQEREEREKPDGRRKRVLSSLLAGAGAKRAAETAEQDPSTMGNMMARSLVTQAKSVPAIMRQLATLRVAAPRSAAAGSAIVELQSATTYTLAEIAIAVGVVPDVAEIWETAALENIARKYLQDRVKPDERWFYESVAVAFSNYGVGRDILEPFLSKIQNGIMTGISRLSGPLGFDNNKAKAVAQRVLGCDMAMEDTAAPAFASPRRSEIEKVMQGLNGSAALKTLYKAHETKTTLWIRLRWWTLSLQLRLQCWTLSPSKRQCSKWISGTFFGFWPGFLKRIWTRFFLIVRAASKSLWGARLLLQTA